MMPNTQTPVPRKCVTCGKELAQGETGIYLNDVGPYCCVHAPLWTHGNVNFEDLPTLFTFGDQDRLRRVEKMLTIFLHTLKGNIDDMAEKDIIIACRETVGDDIKICENVKCEQRKVCVNDKSGGAEGQAKPT